MATDNRYDVIIIGTGAGGGTLAYHLAPSGKRILLLERGGYLPREKDNWDARAVFVESKYRANETWLDRDGKAFHPGIQYYVGGNTKVYGAALLRFRERDFGEVRHQGGISPAWPLSYADFEPYYTKAEYLYHVHGQRGADPTEGPASAPYRHPPVSHESRIQELFDDFRRLGHHPFPLPLGILLDEEDGKALHNSACVRCPAFDGFPCLVNGKADAQVICDRDFSSKNQFADHRSLSVLSATNAQRIPRIQNRTTTCVSGHPLSSKWWCSGARRKTRCCCAYGSPYRLRRYLNTSRWTSTDVVSATNTPPTNTTRNSDLSRIATAPSAPPSASAPVSPMKTCAGCALYQRKPTDAPNTAVQKTVSSPASRK